MIKLDIYKNCRSIKPIDRVDAMGALQVFLGFHPEVTDICAKIKETGDKSPKQQLPAIMPMGTVGDKTRKKENCVANGLVMIDLDKDLDKPMEEDAIRSVVKDMEPRFPELGIRLVHITPSSTGLRIIAVCMKEGMQATIDHISQELGLEKWWKVDPACKDLSRLSYMVPADYILYEKGLFDDVPQESIDAMNMLKTTGVFKKETQTLATVSDLVASDKEHADFEFRGKKAREIAEEFVKEKGQPVEGERHTFYNKLASLFCTICDNNPSIVHAVLPKFGLGDDETWSQCTYYCNNNKSILIPTELYQFLKARGYLGEEEEPAEVDMTIPKMPTSLPPIFRQLVNAAPPDFKVPVVFALAPILGTLTSHVRANYIDGMEQSTEFLSLLYAPPSSGKGFIRRLLFLLDNIRKRDAANSAREEIAAKAERKRSANDKGKDTPNVMVRWLEALISIPEILTKMRNNLNRHMFIMAEELDTFAKSNKNAGGDKSDLWRVTWDNAEYGQYYKSVNTFKGKVKMYLNLLFTGTPDQVERYFKNVEDGLVTRFSFCPIRNQRFAAFTPWKTISAYEMKNIQKILKMLELKNYKKAFDFDPDDLWDVPDEEFDEQVPWQFDLKPLEHVNMSYMYKPIEKWLDEQCEKSVAELNDARDTFRRRAAVKAFRLALLCHALYTKVTKREEELIKNFALWFADVDLLNSLELFGAKYNELQQGGSEKKNKNWTSIYDMMEDEFSISELKAQLKKKFIKTRATQVIYVWKDNRLIEQSGETSWKKIKKK